MAEKKVKVTFPPISQQPLDGVEVPIVESTDRWSEVRLEDGTVLRLKPTVMKATRIEGHWDNEGNPMYVINQTAIMTVLSTPDHLRKQAAEAATTGQPKKVN